MAKLHSTDSLSTTLDWQDYLMNKTEELLKGLKGKSQTERLNAIEALGKSRNPDALDPLLECLSDKQIVQATVRHSAKQNEKVR